MASARRVPKRLAVTWNGYGRPSGFSAMASPSSTTSRAGSASTASTTSGTRAVMSSRLRVKARTSSPRRWTCRRAPSSLYSMAAGPVFASAPSTSSPGAASIGWTGRPTSSPTARSASTPPDRAAAAVVPRSPLSMHARRTASRGTSAARATASTMTPSWAPWRSSPVSSATRKRCSGSVARAKSAASASRRAACDPGPAIAPIASHAASTSTSERPASTAGAGRSRSER